MVARDKLTRVQPERLARSLPSVFVGLLRRRPQDPVLQVRTARQRPGPEPGSQAARTALGGQGASHAGRTSPWKRPRAQSRTAQRWPGFRVSPEPLSARHPPPTPTSLCQHRGPSRRTAPSTSGHQLPHGDARAGDGLRDSSSSPHPDHSLARCRPEPHSQAAPLPQKPRHGLRCRLGLSG